MSINQEPTRQRPNNRLTRGLALRIVGTLGLLGVAGAALPISEPSLAYASTSANEKPTTIFKSTDSGSCFPLGPALSGGPIEADLTLRAHRYYTLYEGEKAVKDITAQLIAEPGAVKYDDFDRDGTKVGEVSAVEASFSDYAFSSDGGVEGQIMRARYGRDQIDTDTYRLERINNEWTNTGTTLTFKKGKPDGQTEVPNHCGQKVLADAIKIDKWRILKDNARRAVVNSIIWIGRNCVYNDNVESDHYLRLAGQPAQPVEEPKPETPARRPISVPGQLPKSGDGSSGKQPNPDLPRGIPPRE